MRITLICYFLLTNLLSIQANDIQTIITRGVEKKWDWGVTIADAATGKVLFDYQGNKKMIPASNQKIITLYHALKTLGPDYAPNLEIDYSGKIVDGHLYGNLIVQGNGAIVFTSRFKNKGEQPHEADLQDSLQPLLTLLHKNGIKTIGGDLIVLPGNQPSSNKRYAAATALLFNENTIDTSVSKGVLSTIPASQEALLFSAHRGKPYQKRMPYHNKRGSKETISIDKTVESVDYWRIEKEKHSVFFKRQLSLYLKQHSITILGSKYSHATSTKLGILKGLSIRELSYAVLAHSDNLRAEMLYLYLLKKGRGAILRSLGAQDGSGFSKANRLSSLQIIAALRALTQRWPWSYECLAVPGQKGTLQHRYRNIPSLSAKTGTLNGVVSLSGFVGSDRKYLFSIIINKVHHREEARRAIGALVHILQKEKL